MEFSPRWKVADGKTQKDLVTLIKAHTAFRHHYSSIFCSDVCFCSQDEKGLETFRPYGARALLSSQNPLDLSPTFQNVNSKAEKWMMIIHLANVVTGNIFVRHLLCKDKIVLLDSAQLWKVKWPGTFIRHWRKTINLQPLPATARHGTLWPADCALSWNYGEASHMVRTNTWRSVSRKAKTTQI